MSNGSSNNAGSIPWGSLLSTVGSALIAATGCAWLVAQTINQANDEISRDLRALSISIGRIEERINQCERRVDSQQLQLDRIRERK